MIIKYNSLVSLARQSEEARKWSSIVLWESSILLLSKSSEQRGALEVYLSGAKNQVQTLQFVPRLWG